MESERFRCWTLAAGVVLAAGVAVAGPLDKSVVDSEAKWLFHFDMDAAKASSVGKFIGEAASREDERFDGFGEIRALGIDPLKDIRDITVYGLDPSKEDGVAMLSTTAVAEKLRDTIPASTHFQNFELREKDGVTYMTWTADGKPLHAAIKPGREVNGRTVLFASSAERLDTALAVIAGGRRALIAGGDAPGLAATPRSGSILFGAAIGLNECAHTAPHALAFREALSMLVDIGETGDAASRRIYADGSLTVTNAEKAVQIQQMLQGVLSFGMLAIQDDPELAPLTDLVRGVKVAANESNVTVSAMYESEQVVSLLKKLADDEADEPRNEAPGQEE